MTKTTAVGIGIFVVAIALSFGWESARAFGQEPPLIKKAPKKKAVLHTPAEFEIRGLRLYMTPQAALPVLQGVATDAKVAVRQTTGPCVTDEVDALKAHKKAQAGRCADMMAVLGSSFEISIFFVEESPSTPSSSQAYRVVLNQPGLSTKGDRLAFFSAITEKYGDPTYPSSRSEGDTSPVDYCSREYPMQGQSCPQILFSPLYPGVSLERPHYPGEIGADHHLGVAMHVQAGSIDLFDSAFFARFRDERKKIIDSTVTARKPVF